MVARSRAYETQVAGAPATVEIEPYQDVAAKLTPDRASGRLKARFKLTVRNRANAPAEVALSAEDTDGELEFRFASPTVTVQAGRGVEAPFTVFPPKQIWLGRPKDHAIRVTVAPVGVEQPPPPLPGTYRQKSWLPWWLAVVAPIAGAIVAALILLAPKQTVVPNLTKAQSVFEAQKMLIPLGLKLQPQPALKPSAGARPGAIVAQAPAAGAKVKRGTSVLVTIAVAGAKTVKVPSVVGLTPVTADTTLRAAGLMLGTVSPQPPDPNGTIATQIPATGTVAAGTPVAVFLQAPPSRPPPAPAPTRAPAAAAVVTVPRPRSRSRSRRSLQPAARSRRQQSCRRPASCRRRSSSSARPRRARSSAPTHRPASRLRPARRSR